MASASLSLLAQYPWWQAPWQRLQLSAKNQRLHHALLLCGREGLGKQLFAEQFAKCLLCVTPQNGEACGQCERCRLFEAGSHPDFFHLQPEEGSTTLKIDQIRVLSDELSLTAQYQGYKVAILQQVDTLTEAAANSLLKTLEEPSEGVILILISARPGALLATIRSRCQKLPMTSPPREQGVQWLQSHEVEDPEGLLDEAHGAPLKALQNWRENPWNEDVDGALVQLARQQITPVSLAEKWAPVGVEVVMARLLYWLDQRIVAALDKTELRPRAQRYYQLRDDWLRVYSDRTPGLNPKATLERCLLDLLACVPQRGSR